MSNQLFFLSLADIFSVYPAIFKEVTALRGKPSQIFLPTDAEWQEKMYYRLLEVQKRVNEALEHGESYEEITKLKDKPAFDPLRVTIKISPETSPTGFIVKNRKRCIFVTPKPLQKTETSFWSLENISKAANLLKKPQLPVTFDNEHEMRKVYSLIYDVFRYKVVLEKALTDLNFYKRYPELANDKNRTWLMLYELYDRRFRERNAEYIELQEKLYAESQVNDIADCLWNLRIRLAAAITRMRVKFGALNLSQLLPIHLQNEKVAIAAANPIVTGWINPFFLKDKETADKFLADMGFEIVPNDAVQPLTTSQYKWDNVCPLFISCIPKDRSEFTRSKLMTKHYFIMQDKTFSYGPAVMSSLLEYFELDGDVLQTHISSPRSTAYLAALFYSVNRVNNFFVYGAGINLKDYRKYMDSLGVSNIRLYSESFSSFPLESKRFTTVVGVFACPPNSFSAISDPIDLICSRGGDLSMLEVLTESEISDDGRRRVSLILEEQLITLQMALSRPQIQFVLYQTHSMVNAENKDMVKHAMNIINEAALEKHRAAFRERKRLEAIAEAEAANIPSAAMATTSPRKRNVPAGDDKSKGQEGTAQTDSSISENTVPEDIEENVQLPDCDEFTVEVVPDICINQDNCLKTRPTGCFLSLIRRKSITRLNAKYLIKMAEQRGLFGKQEGGKSTRPKVVKVPDVNLEKPTYNESALLANQNNKNASSVDTMMARLMQATKASIIRSDLDKISMQDKPIKFNKKRRECSRYATRLISKTSKPLNRSKLWWHYACKSLIRPKSFARIWQLLDVKQSCHLKVLKSRQLKNRMKEPFPIHVKELKVIVKLREKNKVEQTTQN